MSLRTTRNVALYLLGAGAGLGLLQACLPEAPKPPGQNSATPDMAMKDQLTVGKVLTARETFTQKVVPLLIPSCAACHRTEGGIGPAFLASGSPTAYDPYPVTSKWNGFIGDNPELSVLLKKGEHEGPALTFDQYDAVLEWLKREKEERAATTLVTFKQQVKPFIPVTTGADTIVDLEVLDTVKFKGAYIKFRATPLVVSGVTRGLEINNLRFYNVKPGSTAGEQRTLHVKRPLFVVWQGQVAAPDPVDSFNSTDLTLTLDTSATPPGYLITPGLLTLSDYRQGNAISIVFDELRSVPPAQGSNPCKPNGYAYFKANVVPYLNKVTTCVNPGLCHADASSGGINMLPLTGTDDTKIGPICEILKYYNSINVVRENTDPNPQYAHPFKFSGTNCMTAGFPSTCFTDFSTRLDTWKTNE